MLKTNKKSRRLGDSYRDIITKSIKIGILTLEIFSILYKSQKSRRLGDSYREIIMKKKSLGFLSNKVRRSSSDDVSITPPP